MQHIRYFRYIAIHKWFVLLACFRRGLYWQGIVHDWSKFLPSEWFPYANYFYARVAERDRQDAVRQLGYDPFVPDRVRLERFNVAWLKHQHRSPHHYQHWIVRNDDGTTIAIEMPLKYVLEMLSDWDGAGRAITGKSGGTAEWYKKNREKMLLHLSTRALVEFYLFKLPLDP